MAEREPVPCYPWAVPIREQRRMFDALSYEEQLRMVQDAIVEGIESGITENFSMEALQKELDQV